MAHIIHAYCSTVVSLSREHFSENRFNQILISQSLDANYYYYYYRRKKRPFISELCIRRRDVDGSLLL